MASRRFLFESNTRRPDVKAIWDQQRWTDEQEGLAIAAASHQHKHPAPEAACPEASAAFRQERPLDTHGRESLPAKVFYRQAPAPAPAPASQAAARGPEARGEAARAARRPAASPPSPKRKKSAKDYPSHQRALGQKGGGRWTAEEVQNLIHLVKENIVSYKQVHDKWAAIKRDGQFTERSQRTGRKRASSV
ncbi:hypothetical protein WJX73_008572 [Symbiochloris irregularis]|uniref:Myb-like domain-containing protein n=1 Tax=Symbiochloris irregularis TaxID=706552 RepID=A0AAW1NUI5_9CHLO